MEVPLYILIYVTISTSFPVVQNVKALYDAAKRRGDVSAVSRLIAAHVNVDCTSYKVLCIHCVISGTTYVKEIYNSYVQYVPHIIHTSIYIVYSWKTMYYSSQYDKLKSNVSVPIQVPSSGKERDRERQRETMEHRNIRVTVECPALNVMMYILCGWLYTMNYI